MATLCAHSQRQAGLLAMTKAIPSSSPRPTRVLHPFPGPTEPASGQGPGMDDSKSIFFLPSVLHTATGGSAKTPLSFIRKRKGSHPPNSHLVQQVLFKYTG